MNQPPHITTHPLKSCVLDRVKDFLPRMKAANDELEKNKDGNKTENSMVKIENLTLLDSDDDTTTDESDIENAGDEQGKPRVDTIAKIANRLAVEFDVHLIDQSRLESETNTESECSCISPDMSKDIDKKPGDQQQKDESGFW
ncbi:hypothetical protein DdX_12779 [Ditylenchus destructor]|uniref:Uncharacterized protein n=1 Tax=Ditylenchus destructor TaxID=166010 RepID=A0AAD4MX41_9BILA|nr:hypothetical protein DdX_12779 [Ditylenchus destructor]